LKGKDEQDRHDLAVPAVPIYIRETIRQAKSMPFPAPSTGKIAVKVINHYGDEVLKVYTVG
jgi:hypothetical protein